MVFIWLNKKRGLKRKFERIFKNYLLLFKNICPTPAGFVFLGIPKPTGGNRSVKRLFYFLNKSKMKKADSSGGASAGRRPVAAGKESALFFYPKIHRRPIMKHLPLSAEVFANLVDIEDQITLEIHTIQTTCDALMNPVYGGEMDHIAMTLQGVRDRLEQICEYLNLYHHVHKEDN